MVEMKAVLMVAMLVAMLVVSKAEMKVGMLVV
jgi:hypothetical protein